MALASNPKARDRTLAERFAKAGLIFKGVEAGSKYMLHYVREGAPPPPAPPSLRWGERLGTFALHADGFTALDELTADPLLLAHIAWFTRDRRWETFHEMDDRRAIVNRARDRYGALIAEHEVEVLTTICRGGVPTADDHTTHDTNRERLYGELAEAVRVREAHLIAVAGVVGPEPPRSNRRDWWNFVPRHW